LTDADCLDYLDWLRWPGGFVCPKCGLGGGWAVADGRYKCTACGKRTSVTAGTLFDRRRTPLTVWFTACWMFAAQKDGVSALSLQRALEIGSYPTAWAMLHRLRAVLVRPGRDRLSGTVEVDETFIGGEEAGLRGGRAKGKKVLVGVAVEVRQPRGYGRCRMEILADASAGSLRPFLTRHVEPGATVITDAWMGYHGIARLGYAHVRRSQRAARARGEDPGKLLPGGPPGRLPGQALAAGHPPGLGRGQAPAELPERVLLPLQPAPVPQPGAGLLPRARTRRRARSGAVPGPGRRAQAQGEATRRASPARPPAEHRTPAGGPALANRSPRIVRSAEYP
jgi:ISXO2-like transposase domain/Transposase zinc-ribbon domain